MPDREALRHRPASMENVNRLNQERRATANHVWRDDNRVVFQKKK